MRPVAMMMLIGAVGTTGCSVEGDARQPGDTPPVAPAPGGTTVATPAGQWPGAATEAPGAPVVVSVTGPEQVKAGAEIDLRVRIWRSNEQIAPLSLQLRVPDGATLVRGEANETLDPRAGQTIVRSYRLRLADVPSSDLVVEIDWQGSALGLHATAAYRFGRPEPMLAQPGWQRLPGKGGKGGPTVIVVPPPR